MKNLKKLPTKQLEKFSNIFAQLGLVLVLFIVYLTLEHKTEQKSFAIVDDYVQERIIVDPTTEIRFTKELKEVPKQDLPEKQIFVKDAPIEKGDNDIVEKVIDFEPKKEVTEVDITKLVEFKEPGEDIVDDVPYDFIKEAPVFKGCEGLSKQENKECFDKKMKRFVQRNFDLDLASEMGLNSGKHKIFTQFIIDHKGNVVDIKIRTPSKGLEKEAERLIKKLPKFKPGKQNNKFVKVRYTLPISFNVD